jgi:hypothetical protein
MDNVSAEARIQQLEDELKAAERRAQDARRERDESRALVARMEEQVKDANALIERWTEAFDMQLGDSGNWQHTSEHLIDRWNGLVADYSSLLKQWNAIVPQWNAIVAPSPRGVGRPLAASESQCAEVLKLSKRGFSIRAIMDETNLGMQTVRTIIGRENWTDRASQHRLAKIDYKPVRDLVIGARARKRTRDALPRMIAETLKAGESLLKEAKGIK